MPSKRRICRFTGGPKAISVHKWSWCGSQQSHSHNWRIGWGLLVSGPVVPQARTTERYTARTAHGFL